MGARFTGNWADYDVCPRCRVFEGERCVRYNRRWEAPMPAPDQCTGRRLLPKPVTERQLDVPKKPRGPRAIPPWYRFLDCSSCGVSAGEPCVTKRHRVPKLDKCIGRPKISGVAACSPLTV